MKEILINRLKEKHSSIKAIIQIGVIIPVIYTILYFVPFIRENFLLLSDFMYGIALTFSPNLGLAKTTPPWVPYFILSILTIIFILISYPNIKRSYENND